MTEPSPVYQVTWSAEHEADYQKRLLAAYRLVYRAYQIAPAEIVRMSIEESLGRLQSLMSDHTRLLASQWERAQWKKEVKR